MKPQLITAKKGHSQWGVQSWRLIDANGVGVGEAIKNTGKRKGYRVLPYGPGGFLGDAVTIGHAIELLTEFLNEKRS